MQLITENGLANREVMNLKVIKKARNELKLELQGEGHTFANLLESVLLEDEDVEMAGYDVPHPLVQTSLLYLRTKKNHTPEKALESAIERIKEKLDYLSSAFDQKSD